MEYQRPKVLTCRDNPSTSWPAPERAIRSGTWPAVGPLRVARSSRAMTNRGRVMTSGRWYNQFQGPEN